MELISLILIWLIIQFYQRLIPDTMRFKPYSAEQKKERKLVFYHSQISGWESFRSQVKDPNNLLTAEKEINNLKEMIAELKED